MRDKTQHQIALWLYLGAFSIFLQIILGGITRITGSGLSITEWQPLLGALPPMNLTAWNDSFNHYKEIAQFKKINSHFTLSDYQSIFFWEWLHRNWARFIGLLFIIPFVYFLFIKRINRKLIFKLAILFLLGALQGAIGWIMVQSGLNDTSIAVNDIKLAIHFITAIILLFYTLWLAFDFHIKPYTGMQRKRAGYLAGTTLLVLLCQLFYGALMAGSKAALAAPTWPDINGYIVPPGIFEDPYQYLISVQFIHRTLAYTLVLMLCLLYQRTSFLTQRKGGLILRCALLVLPLVQVVLGILTLLKSITGDYHVLAISHQAMGIILSMLVLHIFYVSIRRTTYTR